MTLRRPILLAGAVSLALFCGSAAPGSNRQRSASGGGNSPFAAVRGGLAQVGLGIPTGGAVAIRWLGTGFVVDKRCTIATAKHILQDADRDLLLVRVQHLHDPGNGVPARVLAEDPTKDIAFLRIAGMPGDKTCFSSRLKPLGLAAEFDRESLTVRTVLVAGYPVLEGQTPRGIPILRQGIVSSSELEWNRNPMLLLDLAGIPGFSGAPVILKETGSVIGVIHGPGRTDRRFDLEWATPITRKDYKEATSSTP